MAIHRSHGTGHRVNEKLSAVQVTIRPRKASRTSPGGSRLPLPAYGSGANGHETGRGIYTFTATPPRGDYYVLSNIPPSAFCTEHGR